MSVPGTDLQGWRWLRGRADRREYWLWTVVILAWSYLFARAGDELPQQVLIWAFWLQTIRRLHDSGRSGWWIGGFMIVEITLAVAVAASPAESWTRATPGLIALFGLIGLGCLPGDGHENRFGPPPRRRRPPTPSAHDPIRA